MQIIIDISKELKNEIHNHGLFLCPNDKTALVNAIKHGTPLPKGHGRLIDADAFIKQESCCGYIEDMEIDYFKQNTPTIIEADKAERSE